MPRSLRVAALAGAAGAAVFAALFFAAKHDPRLAAAAPFREDPYDGVGSFAVQLAAAAAALSLLRAARADRPDAPRGRPALVLRGLVVALLAVFVTVFADAVAVLRHRGTEPSGALAPLALLLAASGAAAAALSGKVRRLERASPRRPLATAALAAAGALLLAIYPESWRATPAGVLPTAIFGMAFLFGEVRALAGVLLPGTPACREDFFDDLGAGALRPRAGSVVAGIALLAGLALAGNEALGEGLPPAIGKAAAVLGVFAAIEAAGIMLGWFLLRRTLALRRGEKDGPAGGDPILARADGLPGAVAPHENERRCRSRSPSRRKDEL